MPKQWATLNLLLSVAKHNNPGLIMALFSVWIS